MRKTIDVKKINGQFNVLIDGEQSDVTCDSCKYNVEGKDCKMAKLPSGEYRSDDRLYLFCGNVCGYFNISI